MVSIKSTPYKGCVFTWTTFILPFTLLTYSSNVTIRVIARMHFYHELISHVVKLENGLIED